MNRPRTIELTGRYEGEKFRFNNADGSSIVVGSIKLCNGSKELASEYGINDPYGSLSIKGDDNNELMPSSTYRFLGSFSSYTNRRTGLTEKQFHFSTFVNHVPHDLDGLRNYLVECGRGNGIGPAKAKKLVDQFGVDEVLKVCRTDPAYVSVVAGIDLESATRLAAKLESLKATEGAKLELDKLLTGRGFPKSLVGKLIKEWGNKAAQMVMDDPYRLMQFKGIGFKLADKLYCELGKDPASVDRQALCLWYSMASDQAGHSWFLAEEKVNQLRQSVGSKMDYRAAIVRGRELGKLDVDHYGAIASIRSDGPNGPLRSVGATLWLAEGKTASQEDKLAELVASALKENESQIITVYEDMEIIDVIPASIARCNRCGRALTADIVHVVDGLPYGPTCVEKIGGVA
jgi:hypothetical protein